MPNPFAQLFRRLSSKSSKKQPSYAPLDELDDPLETSTLSDYTGSYDDTTSTQGALGMSKIGRRISHTAKVPSLELLGLSDEMLDEDTSLPKEQGPREIGKNVAREEKLARQFNGLGLDLGTEAKSKLDKRRQKMGRGKEEPQDELEKLAAIDSSGIVPEHAKAISNVSTLRGEIIMTRPVNKDCTKLIGEGSATKHLHIKSKSTDWGPAAGYIPRDGRYSKLGNPKNKGELAIKGMRDSSLAAEKAIHEGWAVPLTMVQREGKAKAVTKPATGDLIYTIPVGSSEESWTNLKSVSEPVLMHPDELTSDVKPLEVLGDPQSMQPIAADYDLFAIGAHQDKLCDEKNKGKVDYKTDTHMGRITDMQKATVMDINSGVMASGHTGGRVAHHGTETQNPVTELDFPLTAFEPDGSIVSVKNQTELVDYFNTNTRKGFELLPNPLWMTDPPDGGTGTWRWSKWSGTAGNWKILPQDLHPVKGEKY